MTTTGTNINLPGFTLSVASFTTSGALVGGSIQDTALGAGVVHSDASGNFTSSNIVNADVDAAAAIAGTKISPNFGSQVVQSTGAGTFGSLSVGSGVAFKDSTVALGTMQNISSKWYFVLDPALGAIRFSAGGTGQGIDLIAGTATGHVTLQGSGGTMVDVVASKIGFFGSTAVVQPTVTGALSTVADAPAKAVLTSIIAALKASGLGLIADGTT